MSARTIHKCGVELITEERNRQIDEENFSLSDDTKYQSGELNDAAICYAKAAADQARGETLQYLKTIIHGVRVRWPWEERWWKPSADPIRNLAKAGALIAAEIDRLQSVKGRF